MALSESKPDKPTLLARHWLLEHLSRDELDKLARYTISRRFKHKEIIFHKGDPGQSMLVVVAGRVRISSHSANGKEVVLNIINPGGIVGEIALLDGEARTADAIAVGEVELLELARRDFLPFLEHHSGVCIKLLAMLCQRLRKTSDQVEDFIFLDQPARLAKTLLRLAECNGSETGGSDKSCVDLKLSQSELGAYAGLRREAVNRQLHQWSDEGIVSLDRGKIWIEQPDALESIGGDQI